VTVNLEKERGGKEGRNSLDDSHPRVPLEGDTRQLTIISVARSWMLLRNHCTMARLGTRIQKEKEQSGSRGERGWWSWVARIRSGSDPT
jgi:hypothetical protein